MPRKRIVSKRKVLPDPRYNSVLVTRFINNLMKKGKKSIAQSILYGAFDIIGEKPKKILCQCFKVHLIM